MTELKNKGIDLSVTQGDIPSMATRSPPLNEVFRALADPTRRAILERLGHGAAGTSALAQHFDMALPSFAQHLAILEHAGMVKSLKLGRIRTYRLVPQQFQSAERWLLGQRKNWQRRFDRSKAP